MQIAMLAGDLQKARAKPVPLSSLIGSKDNLTPRMKSGFSVKIFTGASYHLKYFNLSVGFYTNSHTSNVPRGLFHLIRLCSREATYLFTERKTVGTVSKQIQTLAELSRDYYDRLCNRMIDGQVTFSQLPAWRVGMESTLPQHFLRHWNHRGCSWQVYGSPKLLLSSLLFTTKVICSGNVSLLLPKKTCRDGGQSLFSSAQHGDGKNSALQSELRPEVTVNSLQNLPPTEAWRVKATNQAKLFLGHQHQDCIQMKHLWDLYLSVPQLGQHMNSIS